MFKSKTRFEKKTNDYAMNDEWVLDTNGNNMLQDDARATLTRTALSQMIFMRCMNWSGLRRCVRFL